MHELLSDKKVQEALGPKGGSLQRAVLCLLRAYRLMRTSGRKIDSARLGDLLGKVSQHAQRAGVPLTPKFHQMRHIACQSVLAGNPRFYSAYEDETHNHSITRAAQACFTKNFSARVLAREILQLRTERQQAGNNAPLRVYR